MGRFEDSRTKLFVFSGVVRMLLQLKDETFPQFVPVERCFGSFLA